MAEFVAYVKAHSIKEGEQIGKHGKLGSCPYSLRVLLALEEKGIPYEIEYVNLDNKPDWLHKVNPLGSVPILKDNETGAFVVDSDTISDYLEQKFAATERRKLGNIAEVPQPGSNITDCFMSYLRSGSEEDKKAIEAELEQINAAVGDARPYCGGKEPNAWDVALIPRLYIARVGCKNLKNWDFTENYPNLKTYLHRWTGRPSWRNTTSFDEESVTEELKAMMEKTKVEK